MNRNTVCRSVARVTANEQMESNNNIFHSVSFINRIVIMITIDYYDYYSA